MASREPPWAFCVSVQYRSFGSESKLADSGHALNSGCYQPLEPQPLACQRIRFLAVLRSKRFLVLRIRTLWMPRLASGASSPLAIVHISALFPLGGRTLATIAVHPLLSKRRSVEARHVTSHRSVFKCTNLRAICSSNPQLRASSSWRVQFNSSSTFSTRLALRCVAAEC
jgi:hypothetical protein